tara:strand:- start:162 stop:512 length:351 start_codon:yes stop_codon:yes gene_type:complete
MLIHRIRAALKKFLFLEFNKEYLENVEKAFDRHLKEELLHIQEAITKQEDILTRLLEAEKREITYKRDLGRQKYYPSSSQQVPCDIPTADYSKVETRKRNIEEGVMTGNSWVYKRK